MGTITKDLGIATAYGYAVSKGYTGTEEEFATLMASYATVAEEAAESAEQASQSATNAAASESSASTSASSASSSATAASASATSAGTAASTATTKAGEASASASTASTAATTATTKAGEASQSATNAASSATAAGNAQTAAETAQGKAEDAQTAAEEAAASLVLDTTLTQAGQAAESKAVGDALVNKAPVIITSASGSIANLPDGGEDLPIENLVAEIVPKQDLHGYDNPWPAGGGKNKFNTDAITDRTMSNGNKIVNNSNGSITVTVGSTSSTATTNENLSALANLVAGETYTLSFNTTGTTANIYLRGTSETWSNGASLTITQDALDGAVSFYASGLDSSATISNIMIRKSTDASGFAPYSNICPITGWDGCEVVRTGANVLPDTNVSKTANAVTMVKTGNTVKLTGTASGSGGRLTLKTANFTLKAGTYYLKKFHESGENMPTIHVQNGSNVIRNGDGEFILETDNNEISIAFNVVNGTTYDYTVIIAVYKDDLSTYFPYTGSTYPISWATTSGTVYGGRVNVTTGELVVDMAMVDLGTLTWFYSTNYTVFTTNISNLKYILNDNSTILCSIYTNAPSQSASAPDMTIYARETSGVHGVGVKDSRYTDAASFIAGVSGAQLVYELETPLTYQLTPTEITTLLGQNNIWANCGNTEVEYRADTKLYIERLTQPTEDDMIVNANIASGKYFLVGNALYLSTTAIAAGETIKPGTNCTATNLAAALNALNA